MWRRNYHPLPHDRPEEYLNDAEHRDPSTVLLCFWCSGLDSTRPGQDQGKDTLTLRVRPHRSLYGFRQRPLPNLFGFSTRTAGSFTLMYNATEQLSSFTCESGTYHASCGPVLKGSTRKIVM